MSHFPSNLEAIWANQKWEGTKSSQLSPGEKHLSESGAEEVLWEREQPGVVLDDVCLAGA